MWGLRGRFAMRNPGRTRSPAASAKAASGFLPRPHGADFPPPLVDAASLALQPGFGALAHIAGEKIAAHEAVLGVGGGDRRDGSAGAGAGIPPRPAGGLAILGERLAGRRP